MPHSRIKSDDAPSSSTSLPASNVDLSPELIRKLRAGDAGAGLLLDQLHRGPMLRFCMGYLRNPSDAEDAVQEIFYSALKASLVPDNFRPWLYKIARNQCLQVLRTKQRRPDIGGLPSGSIAADHVTAYLSRLIKVEAVGGIQNLLATLTPEQNELLRLRYAENLSRKEIAEIMEVPEPVIKSRLFETVEKLRNLARSST